MKTFIEFQPTGFDVKGLGARLENYPILNENRLYEFEEGDKQ